MNILVLGGTRFTGIHLINTLLEKGHKITMATRGVHQNPFGNKVTTLVIDRFSESSIKENLAGKEFDVIFDNIPFGSNDVKYILDNVRCKRYTGVSSASVYPSLHRDIDESGFNPYTYPLKWLSMQDASYDEIKRQAECAAFQAYKNIPCAMVRYPYITGEDDYSDRLYFYVQAVVKQKPVYIDNLNEKIPFISSREAGAFSALLAEISFTGPVNASSSGACSMREVIEHVEKATGLKALLKPKGEPAPYNENPSFSLSTGKAQELGYKFSDLSDWMPALLDAYIKRAMRE